MKEFEKKKKAGEILTTLKKNRGKNSRANRGGKKIKALYAD